MNSQQAGYEPETLPIELSVFITKSFIFYNKDFVKCFFQQFSFKTYLYLYSSPRKGMLKMMNSEQLDLNQRRPAPKAGALPNCAICRKTWLR